jgi:hypothetical protein
MNHKKYIVFACDGQFNCYELEEFGHGLVSSLISLP